MRTHIHRATVFMLYQLSLLTGIVMLPMALAMRKAGVELPLHRVIERVGTAYEHATTSAA
jgi:hypothetical protein